LIVGFIDENDRKKSAFVIGLKKPYLNNRYKLFIFLFVGERGGGENL